MPRYVITSAPRRRDYERVTFKPYFRKMETDRPTKKPKTTDQPTDEHYGLYYGNHISIKNSLSTALARVLLILNSRVVLNLCSTRQLLGRRWDAKVITMSVHPLGRKRINIYFFLGYALQSLFAASL